MTAVGDRFGAWTVLGRLPNKGYNKQLLCRCDCGAEKAVYVSCLVAGRSSGCVACGHKRRASRPRTSLRSSPEYKSWCHMKGRCLSPSNPKYPDYGGRGIRVCEQWAARDGFKSFLEDMGQKPSKAHSVDRIDNDGHYEPGNCRWATRREQANNTRVNTFIEIDGRRATIAQWADEFGIGSDVISKRIGIGWSPERAVTEPLKTRGERHPGARFTDADVLEVLRLLRAGVRQQDIADRFGVHNSQISMIKMGKAWAHLSAAG